MQLPAVVIASDAQEAPGQYPPAGCRWALSCRRCEWHAARCLPPVLGRGAGVAEEGEENGGVVLWPSASNNKEMDRKVLISKPDEDLEDSTLNEWKNQLSTAGLVDDYDYESGYTTEYLTEVLPQLIFEGHYFIQYWKYLLTSYLALTIKKLEF